ncbi:SF3a splicing factor complex subunit [Blastocladiella emersonii ATCC 22665]|nr:SF3a splicing factor complex subunit [Blastocladiella emersonii ATCC 22665]
MVDTHDATDARPGAASAAANGDLPQEQAPVPDSVIMPPRDIRTIVDKTANFVARNGPHFEGKIREKEQADPRFYFLNPNDPYHAYYQWMLVEFQAGRATLNGGAPAAQQAADEQNAEEAKASEAKRKAAEAKNKPPPAPPALEFMLDLPPMNAQDLDVIKLTAQFVARNGRAFLLELTSRELRNPLFDFLKPAHPLFPLFTALVEQYVKLITPSPQLLASVRENEGNPHPILRRVQQRARYAHWEEKQHRKEAKAKEVERTAYASIDWNDFVVVQALEFTDLDLDANLPAQTTILALQHEANQVKKARYGLSTTGPVSHAPAPTKEPIPSLPPRPGAANRPAPLSPVRGAPVPAGAATSAPAPPRANDEDEQDMDMDLDVAAKPASAARTPAAAPAPVGPSVGPMKIKSAVVPRKTATNEPTTICERCGLAIPDSQMEEHIRIELLDPKWREQREAHAASRRETNLVTTGDHFVSTLKSLAENRPDIFGGDEVDRKRKLEEDARRQRKLAEQRVTWDGHTASIATTTMKVKEVVPLEDQIAAIHRSKGLVETPEDRNAMLPARPTLPGSIPRGVPPPPPSAPAASSRQPPMAPSGMRAPPPPTSGRTAPPPPPRGAQPPPPPRNTRLASDTDIHAPNDAKRQKLEDALVPEAAWLVRHPGAVPLTVEIPNDKFPTAAAPSVAVTAPSLAMSVEDVKAAVLSQLQASVPDLTIGKLKLTIVATPGASGEAGRPNVAKNQMSLAFYNVHAGSQVVAGIRERGGGRK